MDKYEVLKQAFGYTSFREGQERLVDSTLSGRDVLGIPLVTPASVKVRSVW